MRALLVCLLALGALIAPAFAQTSDALMFAKAKTCTEYQAFVANYPASKYAANAKARLGELKCFAPVPKPAGPPRDLDTEAAMAAGSDCAKWKSYKQRFPSGKFAATANEWLASSSCKSAIVSPPPEKAVAALPLPPQPAEQPSTTDIRSYNAALFGGQWRTRDNKGVGLTGTCFRWINIAFEGSTITWKWANSIPPRNGKVFRIVEEQPGAMRLYGKNEIGIGMEFAVTATKTSLFWTPSCEYVRADEN